MACKRPREDHGVPQVHLQLFLCGQEALPATSLQVKGAEGSFPGELKELNFVRLAMGGESNLTEEKGTGSHPHHLSSIQYLLEELL